MLLANQYNFYKIAIEVKFFTLLIPSFHPEYDQNIFITLIDVSKQTFYDDCDIIIIIIIIIVIKHFKINFLIIKTSDIILKVNIFDLFL